MTSDVKKQRGRISFDSGLTIVHKAALILPFIYFCFGMFTNRIDYNSAIFFAATWAFVAAFGVMQLLEQTFGSAKRRREMIEEELEALCAEYELFKAEYEKLKAEYEKFRGQRV